MNDILENRTNSFLDYVKAILAIMVVALHAIVFPDYTFPWLSLAVPLFFIMSSYFFFAKQNRIDNDIERHEAYKKYIQRNFMFYIFWFLVLLPATIFLRKSWFENGILWAIGRVIKGFLFNGTFMASWFIMALIIGITIIYYSAKKLSNKKLFYITGLIYAVVCLRCSYYPLIISTFPWIEVLVNSIESITAEPMSNFVFALFWLTCGKCFADGTFEKFEDNRFITGIITVLSALLLWIEWEYCKGIMTKFHLAALFLMAPTLIGLFAILKNINFYRPYSLCIRKFSTITYGVHATALTFISAALKRTIGFSELRQFVIGVMFCILLTAIIIRLEKQKHFKWLRYAY